MESGAAKGRGAQPDAAGYGQFLVVVKGRHGDMTATRGEVTTELSGVAGNKSVGPERGVDGVDSGGVGVRTGVVAKWSESESVASWAERGDGEEAPHSDCGFKEDHDAGMDGGGCWFSGLLGRLGEDVTRVVLVANVLSSSSEPSAEELSESDECGEPSGDPRSSGAAQY